MKREQRPTKGETPTAPTKKLDIDSTSDVGPDTAVQLGRLETILNRTLDVIAPASGAR